MKQYIWFHPRYIKETQARVVEGQMANALRHGYMLLGEHELHKVGVHDHLTLVGHSSGPDDDDDTGCYMQGDSAPALVTRLQHSGLRVAPRALSLECCQAGCDEGLAFALSRHAFFRYTVIEANPTGIGRNSGHVKWNLTTDVYGRVLYRQEDNPWIFLLNGRVKTREAHASYRLHDVVQTLLEEDIHESFMEHYRPGCFGGRIGRYGFFTKERITLDLATLFAREKPASACSRALDDMAF